MNGLQKIIASSLCLLAFGLTYTILATATIEQIREALASIAIGCIVLGGVVLLFMITLIPEYLAIESMDDEVKP